MNCLHRKWSSADLFAPFPGCDTVSDTKEVQEKSDRQLATMFGVAKGLAKGYELYKDVTQKIINMVEAVSIVEDIVDGTNDLSGGKWTIKRTMQGSARVMHFPNQTLSNDIALNRHLSTHQPPHDNFPAFYHHLDNIVIGIFAVPKNRSDNLEILRLGRHQQLETNGLEEFDIGCYFEIHSQEGQSRCRHEKIHLAALTRD